MQPHHYGLRSNEEMALSSAELAILEFTNDGDFDPKILRNETRHYGQRFILTGKESYFWAVTVALLCERYGHVDVEPIHHAYNRAVQDNLVILRDKYQATFLSFDEELSDKAIFQKLFDSFLMHLDCHELSLREVVSHTQHAFDSLLQKGLIEDPIEIAAGTVAIAVLGFIPFGFTTKTRRGRVVYRKVSATYWTYERKRVRNEDVTKFSIRLVKVLSAFKQALIDVSQDNIDDVEK